MRRNILLFFFANIAFSSEDPCLLTLTDRSSTGVRNLSVNSLNRGNIDCDVTINRTFTSGDRNGIDGLVVIVSNSLNRDGRSAVNLGTSLVEPSVGGVLIREAVDIGVQGDELAFANVHLISSHLEVRTVGDHLNRSGSVATSLSVGGGNRIDTGNCGIQLSIFSVVLVTPNIIISVLILCIIRIHKRSRSRSGQSSRSAVANDVITRDRNLRSSNNNNVLFNRDSSNFTSLNNSLSCNIV